MVSLFRDRLLLLSLLISISLHFIVLGASPTIRRLASLGRKEKYIEVLFYQPQAPLPAPKTVAVPDVSPAVNVQTEKPRSESISQTVRKKIEQPRTQKKEIDGEQDKKTIEKAKKEFAPQAAMIKKYTLDLDSIVKAYVRLKYPEIAKKQGIEAKVLVVFCLNNKGRLTYINIPKANKSNLEEFNNAALESIKEASKHFPPFPNGIDQSEIMFSLEVVFELYD
ncbi:MAG: TonB family protein [bacterium]|nr:TonB family protein [Candidatus Auribacterota bacterium]MDD5645498.1 TonB family protein [bacterium]